MRSEDLRMRVQEIEHKVALLYNSIRFRTDYPSLKNGTKKLLIVEGFTDEQFIKDKLSSDVVCLIANKAFGSNQNNYKEAILHTVLGLTQFSSVISLPDRTLNMKVYGLVDLDDENAGDYVNKPNLFVMDTHDLETLIMSTDKDIFARMEGGMVSEDEVQKSLFLAFQLNTLRKILREECKWYNLEAISSDKNRNLRYDQFVENETVSIRKIIRYLSENSSESLSREKEKQLVEKISKSKSIKKLVDSEGKWKITWKDYCAVNSNDIWKNVQGHDVLSIIRYYNSEVAQKFFSNTHSLNREFELALIRNYDYSNFTKTILYERLRSEGIINSIS